MTNSHKPLLLTDDQMKAFIRDGVLLLNTDFPRSFHDSLVAQLNDVYQEEGNPGNNILPRIRDLQKVFDHPVVTGALTSVLGPDYLLHTHRHGHFNASPQPGGWHKDSYWGYSRMRNHHPWWAMIMYFPQDTPLELGPTGIFPGTQFLESRIFDEENPAAEVTAQGEAGTFALIHYDVWHRSTANIIGQPRYMLKFEFMRTTAPAAPTWNNIDPIWTPWAEGNHEALDQSILWEENWNWLSGQIGSLTNTLPEDSEAIGQLTAKLAGPGEPTSLNAAYSLAASGIGGISALLEALRHEDNQISRKAAYGLSAAGQGAVAGLLKALGDPSNTVVIHAAFALGELRELAAAAIPQLAALLGDSSPEVRRQVIETLGLIGKPSEGIVPALIRGLRDEDVQTRFMAALSLLRLKSDAADAIPELAEALGDSNRYVRGHAAEALRYIDSPEARDILFRELFNLRWCSDTTKASTF
ncbi:HEAT repeat [Paenibacillaceae bacterium GAS479]|nr:HEAT repeat [Paenibacillaceae bacterium GAS479]